MVMMVGYLMFLMVIRLGRVILAWIFLFTMLIGFPRLCNVVLVELLFVLSADRLPWKFCHVVTVWFFPCFTCCSVLSGPGPVMPALHCVCSKLTPTQFCSSAVSSLGRWWRRRFSERHELPLQMIVCNLSSHWASRMMTAVLSGDVVVEYVPWYIWTT